MLLGCIADDFTGASDLANTLAKGGLRTIQFIGLPGDEGGDCDAGVIALKSRSIPAQEAIRQSLAALDWLLDRGCRQFLFKICSTFDSTPEGNIGPVAEALADALGVRGVAVCPAFPTTGRTVYQGHLFVGDRPLNESGLEKHPLNPMTDADIRRWLSRQAKGPVGLVPWTTVSQGADAIRHALGEAGARSETLVVVDAIRDDDLVAIGRACRGSKLLVGGSGIALGLPANFIEAGHAQPGASAFAPASGPEVILAGSCSRATLEQVARHATAHPTLKVDPGAIIAGQLDPPDIVAFAQSHAGQAPLVYSSAEPADVTALQAHHGREHIAQALDAFFAECARRLVAGGIARLVVAGGETSGAVVSALGLRALAIGPEIDPGVPALSSVGENRIALALKSGNFGSPEFFEKALRVLERRP